jgi:hypothetical protein
MADDTPLPDLPSTTTGSCPKTVKRYAMVEVETNDSASCTPCGASSTGSGTTSTDVLCPTNPAPLFAYTLNTSLTLPGLGSEFTVPMCSALPWTPGMWVEHEVFGRFPIVRIDGANLVLRNSCDDGGEIPGNAGSGTQSQGQKKVWPTNDACRLKEEVFDAVDDFFDETEELCFPMPEITGSQRIKLVGPLAECTNSCDGTTDPGDNCIKKTQSVYANNETILAPAAPTIALAPKTINGTPFNVLPVLYDPADGAFKPMQIPADGAYSLVLSGGQLTLGASEVQAGIYDTSKNVATGSASIGSTVKDLATISGVTVPSWATHAILECHAQIQTGDLGVPDTTKPSINVYIGSRLATTVGRAISSGTLWNTRGANTREITAKMNGSSITYNVDVDNITSGGGVIVEWWIKLVGFTVAQSL